MHEGGRGGSRARIHDCLRGEVVGLVGLLALIGLVALASGCRSVPVDESRGALDMRPLAERVADPAHVAQIERIALTLRRVGFTSERSVLRQRVQIEWSGGRESFDAVLQQRPGELSLIGLGPMDLVGFRLALFAAVPGSDGADRLEFENHSGRELPFSPAHILADVQRVFYPWLLDVRRCASCERTERRGSVAVSETFADDRLVLRRFEIPELPEAGRVEVRYADWQGDPAFPGRVVIENGWFGYRITIETLESLEAPTPVPPE